MYGKLKKVNTTLYLNKYINIGLSQLYELLRNMPVLALLAANYDFINYSGVDYPFNCTYSVTSDNQITYAVMVLGYDSNANLLISASGLPSWGGTAYNNTTSTGIGFGKISPVYDYCGIRRRVYQYWTSNNYTNQTYSYYVYGKVLANTGACLILLFLIVA